MGEGFMGSTATMSAPPMLGPIVAPRSTLQKTSTTSRTWDRAASVELAEATAFLRMYHAARGGPGRWERHRLAEVRAEIERTGTYTHTREELIFGTRVAWRGANRSVARDYWLGVEVRDLRHVATADEIFAELVEHLELTARSGRYPIRPVISVLSPAAPHQPATRLWNRRLVALAGYQRPDGRVVGDPSTVDFTATALAYGWRPLQGTESTLPLVVDSPREGVRLFDLPEGVRRPVRTIANLRLCIGGISYPIAPFNVAGNDHENRDRKEGARTSASAPYRPRFRLDPLAETLARYGRAPEVPGVVARPEIPAGGNSRRVAPVRPSRSRR
jgi:nitric oxide synthase oxygenase domain/subunit